MTSIFKEAASSAKDRFKEATDAVGITADVPAGVTTDMNVGGISPSTLMQGTDAGTLTGNLAMGGVSRAGGSPVIDPTLLSRAPGAAFDPGALGPRDASAAGPAPIAHQPGRDVMQFDPRAGAASREMQMAALAGMQNRPRTAGLQMAMARDAAMQQAMAAQAGARGMAPGAAMRAGLQGLQPGLAGASSAGINAALQEQAAQQRGVSGLMGQIRGQDFDTARQQEALRQGAQGQRDQLIDAYLRQGMSADQAAMAAKMDLLALASGEYQADQSARAQNRAGIVGALGSLGASLLTGGALRGLGGGAAPAAPANSAGIDPGTLDIATRTA